MKRFLLILMLALLIGACEKKPEKQQRRIAWHRVFVVKDSTDEEKRPKRPLAVDTSYIEYIFKSYDLVNIRSLDSSIMVRLQYADTTNFLKRNFYDGLRKAYFTCETAQKICAAQYYLKQVNSDYSLIIFDATRPHHLQQMMWDSLQLPALTKLSYLSDPSQTSMHNYGCAVDCSIVNTLTGELLDMGTGYDTFDKLSQPVMEYQYLRSGELSREAFNNRRLLRQVMKRAKMNGINTEWWHFSSVSKSEAMANYTLVK